MPVVKKTSSDESIDLVKRLAAVKASITKAPSHEGTDMSVATATTAKPAAKKPVVKKATEAKPAKKSADKEMVTLADLCKELKMEPRTARKKLRGAENINVEGQRWSWPVGSAELTKVKKLLAPAS